MGVKSISRIIKAFLEGKSAKDGHDRTENGKLYYRDNCIAWKDLKTQCLFIDTCGWKTITIKSRLNQIPNLYITIKKGVWYVNYENRGFFHWDGKLLNLTTRTILSPPKKQQLWD